MICTISLMDIKIKKARSQATVADDPSPALSQRHAAGPSSPRASPPPRKLPIASARPLPSPAIAIAGSARDSEEVNIKGPAPAVKNAFAGALKKSADGQAVQPRVIQRRQKMVRELVLFEACDKCADTPFNSLLAGYARSQMMKATRRIWARARKTVTMMMVLSTSLRTEPGAAAAELLARTALWLRPWRAAMLQ